MLLTNFGRDKKFPVVCLHVCSLLGIVSHFGACCMCVCLGLSNMVSEEQSSRSKTTRFESLFCRADVLYKLWANLVFENDRCKCIESSSIRCTFTWTIQVDCDCLFTLCCMRVRFLFRMKWLVWFSLEYLVQHLISKNSIECSVAVLDKTIVESTNVLFGNRRKKKTFPCKKKRNRTNQHDFLVH